MAEAVRHDKAARQLRMPSEALAGGRLVPLRRRVGTLSPAGIGNLLESLPRDPDHADRHAGFLSFLGPAIHILQR